MDDPAAILRGYRAPILLKDIQLYVYSEGEKWYFRAYDSRMQEWRSQPVPADDPEHGKLIAYHWALGVVEFPHAPTQDNLCWEQLIRAA